MDHNSPRKGGQEPPFQIVLNEGCSIVCDEVPVNCTIRVMPVDGRSPPRMSPMSQWGEDYSLGDSPERHNWGPQPRDKRGRVVGSPIMSPPSPMRSRRSIAESMRRNSQENSGATSSADSYRGFGEAECDILGSRTPSCSHEFESPSPIPSYSSSSSHNYTTASSSRPPSSPPAEQSATGSTDRLLNSDRPQMDFSRTNIHVEGPELREMHSNLGPRQTYSTAVQPTKSTNASPQSSSRSPSPPSSSGGRRCCGMADYNPGYYGSMTPDTGPSKPVQTGSAGAVSVPATSGGTCTYHRNFSCPTLASSRCRENRLGEHGGSRFRFPGAQRSCSYHNELPCPVLAGVPCRGEMQKSGVSSPSPSRPPSPDAKPPKLHGAEVKSQSSPGMNPRQGSPGGSSGVAYPPRTISPPPKNPRSKTPSRRAIKKCKGVCL